VPQFSLVHWCQFVEQNDVLVCRLQGKRNRCVRNGRNFLTRLQDVITQKITVRMFDVTVTVSNMVTVDTVVNIQTYRGERQQRVMWSLTTLQLTGTGWTESMNSRVDNRRETYNALPNTWVSICVWYCLYCIRLQVIQSKCLRVISNHHRRNLINHLHKTTPHPTITNMELYRSRSEP
jgi:hypothetical protein